MPKPIKKRAERPKRGEEELESLLSKARSVTAGRERRLIGYAAAVLIIAALAAGVYFYRAGIESKAAALEYEGYRNYHGLYEQVSVDDYRRAQAALESFSRANELSESPFSLMYAANSQYALGNYAGAAETLEELTRKFPGERRLVPVAQYKLALARLNAGQEEAALKALERLYTPGGGPYEDLALAEAARLLESMDRSDEANAMYGIIARDFPDSSFAGKARQALGIKEEEAAPEGSAKSVGEGEDGK